MKLDGYQIRLNIKSCCMYEQIFKKNFFKMNEAEDVLELMYCCVVVNNPSLMMTYNTFKVFVQDAKVSKWLEKEYRKISEFNAQIKSEVEEGENEDKDQDEEELTLTNVASTLIVKYGIDPHYVMFEMELWEIQPYLNSADIQRKAELVEKRFWTYLTIAPHIDGKKIKKPEDLVPFEWEKSEKRPTIDAATSAAALSFLRGRAKSEEEIKGNILEQINKNG